MIQENNLDVFLSHLEFQQAYEQETHNRQLIGGSSTSSIGPDARYLDRAVLEQRAIDIREKLKYTATTHYLPHLPPKELLQAVELVTANNIELYLQFYFKHWHKHTPIVHEATFNPCTSALPLVLALMCLGGMVSTENPVFVLGVDRENNTVFLVVFQRAQRCHKAQSHIGHYRGIHIFHPWFER
jgi:hypothetical protein